MVEAHAVRRIGNPVAIEALARRVGLDQLDHHLAGIGVADKARAMAGAEQRRHVHDVPSGDAEFACEALRRGLDVAHDIGDLEMLLEKDGNGHAGAPAGAERSEEHTSELQSLMRISYAVFCLKNKKNIDMRDMC